jgi:hypothetical protein
VNATTTQQHDIKSLAQAVLARNRRNSERNNSASTELRTPATGAKNSLRIAAAEQLHGIRIAELRELAGKDWPELEANPELLECFADMVAVRHMRERGEVPPSYTAVTVCAGCGPVPIFPGVAEKVEGCPWCLNRAAGRPVPRVGAKNAT